MTAPRRSSEVRLPVPRLPSRCDASDSTASQVVQGGGKRGACAAAQRWLASRRLRSATRNPASTSVLAAIPRRLQVFLGPRAHIARQPVDRTDDVLYGIEQRRRLPAPSLYPCQPLAHHVGLRQPAPTRLSFDLGDQDLGQPNRQCLHASIVLRSRRLRNTSRRAAHTPV